MRDVKVGDSCSLVLVDELTRTQIVQYAGALGDYNPLHTDDRFTTEVAGYPSVFAHGMLTMGMTGRVLTDWFGPEALTAYARFVQQVWPGDSLTATATVTDVRDTHGGPLAALTIETVNQNGDVVLTGTATAASGGAGQTARDSNHDRSAHQEWRRRRRHGSGATRADVAVRDGRVVAIGTVDEPARRTIDAASRVVVPGFVDVHTHLDAQAFWDPYLSPSPLHGVTTVIAGNCGFTIAPLTEDAGRYLMPMLAKVEGMPCSRSGRRAVELAIDGRLLRPAGRPPRDQRRVHGRPFGDASRRDGRGRQRTGGDRRRAGADDPTHPRRLGRRRVRLLHDHVRHPQRRRRPPGPSRFADDGEFIKLARVCGEYEGTSLELLPQGATGLGPFADDVADLMITMSATARRPLNWNVIQPTASNLDSCLAKLALGDHAAARGGKVIGLTMPVDMKARFSFHSGFVLDVFDGWAPIMNAPTEEKLRAQRPGAAGAPGRAGRRHEEHAPPGHVAGHVIVETFAPENRGLAGRRVGEIADELGKDPFDALVDIAIADGLRTTFTRATPAPTAADWQARLQIWNDRRAMIGASDAGAHLDMIAAFRYSTGFLDEAVRQHQLLPLERAIHLLTGAPARLYGLRDRGAPARATRPTSWCSTRRRSAGAGRDPVRPAERSRAAYAEALGIDHVSSTVPRSPPAVGTPASTPARLRAGRDSATPTLDL